VTTYNQAPWEAVADQEWLVVAASADPGDGGTLTLVAQPNPGARRVGTVTVGSGGTVATITVTQGG
jgi:hypothetical protein